MCALTAPCSANCVVSTKQSQCLQTGLRLRDRNAIIKSKQSAHISSALYDSDCKNGSEQEGLSYRKLPMDKYANCGTILTKVCNFTNHEKSGICGKKDVGRSVFQYKAKQDLILISKRNFWCSCNLDVFCDRGMAILQIKFGFFSGLLNSRLGLFWPLFCIVWLFIEIFIWKPWLCRVRFYIWILFSVCGGAVAFSNKPFRQ